MLFICEFIFLCNESPYQESNVPTATVLPNIWFQWKVQNLSFTKAAGDQVHKLLQIVTVNLYIISSVP